MPEHLPPDVAAGLRRIRALHRRYWAVSFSGVPAVSALGLALAAAGVTGGWVPGALLFGLGVGWLWAADRAEARVAAAHCPRCGELFHVRPATAPPRLFQWRGVYPRRCQHCGLRLRGGGGVGACPAGTPNVALQATPYTGQGQRGPEVHRTPAPSRPHNGAPELGR